MQNPPPVQTSSQPPAQVAKSSTGLDENVAALLSYIAGWITGLVFFLIEKDSRLVRFHAMQSLILSGGGLVIIIALWIFIAISSFIIGQISTLLSFLVSTILFLVVSVVGIAILIGAIIGLVKAYQGQYFKLPVIGNLAEKYSTK
jgi:uncharacterized membrane protein